MCINSVDSIELRLKLVFGTHVHYWTFVATHAMCRHVPGLKPLRPSSSSPLTTSVSALRAAVALLF